MVMAVRDSHLLCSAHDEAFYAYQPWKEIEIEFTQKDFFSAIRSVQLDFLSRQNTQWYLLDLSVLNYLPIATVALTAGPFADTTSLCHRQPNHPPYLSSHKMK